MTLIPELDRALETMSARRARQRRRRRLLAAAPVLIAATTTAALAATGVIPVGSTVTAPGSQHRKRDVGTGVLVPGTDRVLELATQDPDGGPPWGLRIVSTTRGLGCLQVGRLVEGRIGVLGRDGAFGDDGRFHPFDLSTIGDGCAPLDGAGRLFANSTRTLLPASASLEADCYPRAAVRGVPPGSYCDDRSLRNLYYGTLGPEAESITVNGRAIALAGPEGAYLLVLRSSASTRAAGVGGAGPWPVSGPITSIGYRDGTTCAIGWAGPTSTCPRPGYTPAPQPVVTARTVPVRVKVEPRTSGRWRATVRFTAPVAVPDASSHYEISIRPPRRQPGGWTSAMVPTDRNIALGETVRERFRSLREPGRWRGVVSYRYRTDTGMQRTVIGRFSFRIP